MFVKDSGTILQPSICTLGAFRMALAAANFKFPCILQVNAFRTSRFQNFELVLFPG